MAFTISAVTYDDAAVVSKNNMTAFYHTDTHWRALWKSTPLNEIIEGATARMPHSLAGGREKKRHQKAVVDDGGEVVGYARWILPDDDHRISWPEAAVREPSQEEVDDFRAAFQASTDGDSISGMDGKLQAALGLPLEEAEIAAMRSQEGPFLVLDYLAVHPDYRRKGIASALVKEGLEQANAVGMKVWVMATKTAQPMYEKLGFELVDTVETSVTEFGIAEPHKKAFLMKR
ncbi:acyl-CoA N-acyltransferase [Colletotrichum acutatum]|uniref:Acyl-CoA N-acyltransferase n=1 Tax=Glomerella acutata TaxID=27357 RepID=A0AAD8UDP7_GLOAC|nr:acyl-CoA N-acyltransferase [Colletotrichum acutatum]KAK1713347.1 acyl-CoA N-acyltransferase [Colletotrichum acutatum]